MLDYLKALEQIDAVCYTHTHTQKTLYTLRVRGAGAVAGAVSFSKDTYLYLKSAE